MIGTDRLMRDILRHCLQTWDVRFDCVLEAPAEVQVLRRCRATAVDLVVFDAFGDGVGELSVLTQLQEIGRWALLVIAARRLPEHVMEDLLVRERCGVITRNGSLDSLVQAAGLVAMGGTYLDTATQEILRRKIVRGSEAALSHRERHVLQLVAEGYSTKEVANLLQLSAKTVDKYRTSVMQKLNTHDVVKLTHQAIRMGLVHV